jgi:hypothetical protein
MAHATKDFEVRGLFAPQPATAAEQGDGECPKCGAPTDPDYGHVGDCPQPEARGVDGLQRYFPSKPSHPGWEMTPHKDGEWVLFADVQVLDATPAALGAAVNDQMVETVGSALYIHWNSVNEQARNAYRKKVRAALTAALAGKDGA